MTSINTEKMFGFLTIFLKNNEKSLFSLKTSQRNPVNFVRLILWNELYHRSKWRQLGLNRLCSVEKTTEYNQLSWEESR
jgi:hypothetical protein